MTCPKCGSANVMSAVDEAPPGDVAWMKCWACGKRWDQSGRMLREVNDDHGLANGAIIEHQPGTRSGDELVSTIMRIARQTPAVPNKEKTLMNGEICTKKGCEDESADDSVQCPKHRDQQRKANANYQGRAVPVVATPKLKHTNRQMRQGGTPPTAVATIEPKVVSARPVRSVDLTGNVLTVLDGLIEQREADLVMLRGTKEILERGRNG